MKEVNKQDFLDIGRNADSCPWSPRVKRVTGGAGGGPVPPTLCFSGVKELLPGHINSFPHHPCPPHPLSPAPPSPQGECVCAKRVSMGGGGTRVFNNATFNVFRLPIFLIYIFK